MPSDAGEKKFLNHAHDFCADELMVADGCDENGEHTCAVATEDICKELVAHYGYFGGGEVELGGNVSEGAAPGLDGSGKSNNAQLGRHGLDTSGCIVRDDGDFQIGIPHFFDPLG